MALSRPYAVSERCTRCLKIKPASLRRYLSSTATASHLPCPPSSAYAPLPTRRLVSLHGQDAPHFLQGLTTSNISPSLNSSGHYSAFLNASGRVLYDVFIYPAARSKEYRKAVSGLASDDPGFLIEVDANEAENLAKHLRRFKLRAKVGIQIMEEEEWGVWSTWPRRDDFQGSEIWCLDSRAPGMGYRVVGSHKYRPQSGIKATLEQYEVRRMMMGIAEGQAEIFKESALPQESNIDYMGGIDFRKGCYVGQELTIRTHHTGVVRKRILPVQIYHSGEGSKPPDVFAYDPTSKLGLPPKGANISRVDRKGRSAGRWLGGVGNVGLALCRLEVMTDTVLTTEGNSWSPEHEFRVVWEPEEGRESGEVRIKAFVPDWHKERARAQSSHRGDGGKPIYA